MFSRFFYVIAFYPFEVLFTTKQGFILWIYNVLFIHSTSNEHLSCFHFLDITNDAAINIHIRIFVWTYIFFSLGYIAGSKISGSYGKPMFSLLQIYLIIKVFAWFYLPPAVFESFTFSTSYHTCDFLNIFDYITKGVN